MASIESKLLNNVILTQDGILQVDHFLNHQLDIDLLEEAGKEIARRFKGEGVTKILTVESSGIPLACFTAQTMGVSAVYARKFQIGYMSEDVFETEVHSFSQNKAYTIRVSKKAIQDDDVVLIVDDFLANGMSILGLCEIVMEAGAEIAGVSVVFEKAYMDGPQLLRQRDVRVEALVTIARIENGVLVLE